MTAYVDLNLFELQASKLKMKFSDVQVKGEGEFGDCVRGTLKCARMTV